MRHDRLLIGIERFVEGIGRIVSLSIFLLIGIVSYELAARYFFNAPTRWVYDTSGWFQVAYVFLGGAYALQKGAFVRVDLFYGRMSPRAQAWIDVTIGTALFILFASVMLWRGLAFAISSYNMNEVSSTGAWSGPVWPAKFMIPVGTLLLSLAWFARVVRHLSLLFDRGTKT
jgi:TRAP-type mannitol/chloroaromatic compound transport system permease small subunit